MTPESFVTSNIVPNDLCAWSLMMKMITHSIAEVVSSMPSPCFDTIWPQNLTQKGWILPIFWWFLSVFHGFCEKSSTCSNSSSELRTSLRTLRHVCIVASARSRDYAGEKTRESRHAFEHLQPKLTVLHFGGIWRPAVVGGRADLGRDGCWIGWLWRLCDRLWRFRVCQTFSIAGCKYRSK